MENIQLEIDKRLKRMILDLECRINPILLSAIEYSLFPAGKRIRPNLCITAFGSVGGVGDKILPYACALEMIHTSSLIKDDLPAMDNHKERRGKPTVWVKFGEATAMMAADLLTAEAYRILLAYSDPSLLIECLNTVITMINGQDLDCRGIRSTEVNKLKTASLFETCFIIGARVGGATDEQVNLLRQQGLSYGMDFQLKDDIKDKDGISDFSNYSS